MRTISVILAAGEPNEITAPGRFLYVVEAPDGVSLSFDGKPQMAGMLAGTWVKPGPFERVRLLSDTAQTVKLMVGDGEAGVFRVAGEVSVISGELSRSKAGTAFIGGIGITASAGKYGLVQVVNPAGSAKNLNINKLIVYNTDSTLETTIYRGAADIAAAISYLRNKKVGAADSVAFLTRLDSLTTGAAVAGALHYLSFLIPAYSGLLEIPLEEPILLEPGQSLLFSAGAPASAVRVSMQAIEEDA